MLKRIAVLAFTLAVCSVGFTAPASAESEVGAMARPTGCRAEVAQSKDLTSAICSSHNGGSYRALAICKSASTGELKNHEGPWRQTGVSNAYCQGDGKAQSAGFETSVRNNT